MPYLYVRVLMDQVAADNAFIVPQQAVTRGAKDTVMIVNAQGGMQPREVTVAQQQGTNWIVTSGLKDGDKVVVEGISIAGMTGAKKVTPKEWPPSENRCRPRLLFRRHLKPNLLLKRNKEGIDG